MSREWGARGGLAGWPLPRTIAALPRGPALWGTMAPWPQGLRPCALECPAHPAGSPHWAKGLPHRSPEGQREGTCHCLIPTHPGCHPFPCLIEGRSRTPTSAALLLLGPGDPEKKREPTAPHMPSSRSSLEQGHSAQRAGQTLVWAAGEAHSLTPPPPVTTNTSIVRWPSLSHQKLLPEGHPGGAAAPRPPPPPPCPKLAAGC